MSCTNCGSPFHERWACPKPIRISTDDQRTISKALTSSVKVVSKSTAARTDVSAGPEADAKVNRVTGGQGASWNTAAGTQAPPVDLPKIEAETAHLAPKKRGRPATGFDKKAYDKQKAKERRAKRKKQDKTE